MSRTLMEIPVSLMDGHRDDVKSGRHAARVRWGRSAVDSTRALGAVWVDGAALFIGALGVLSVACLSCVGCGGSRPLVPVIEPQILDMTWETHETPGTPKIWNEVSAKVEADGKHRVLMLSHGDESLALRVNLIRSARKSIEIQAFIWTNDECGRLITWELIKAVKQRGVHVRLIVDQMFSDQDVGVLSFLATLDPKLEIEIYNPNAKRLAPGTIRTLVKLVTEFTKVNMRMHNKLMVVDDRIAISGGRNIANEYFDRVLGLNFKDRDILAVGPVAKRLRESFDEFVESAWSVPARRLRDVKKRIESGGIPSFRTGTEFWFNGLFDDLETRVRDRDWIRKTFVDSLLAVEEVDFIVDRPGKNDSGTMTAGGQITEALIGYMLSAERSILIQSPYLTMSDRAIRVFRAYRETRPEGRFAVSTNCLAATDSWPTYGASYKQKRVYLEEFGLEIHEFKPLPQDIASMMRYEPLLERKPTPEEAKRDPADKFTIDPGLEGRPVDRRNLHTKVIPYLCLHQKSFVIDDEIAFIGSYNFDPRSGNLNTEVGIVVKDPKFAAIVSEDIERDMSPRNSYLIGKRQLIPGIDTINKVIHEFSENLPVDFWPVRYATSFDLLEGAKPVPPGHPDFYENWRDAGSFPLLGLLGDKAIFTALFKTIGGALLPVL